MAKASLPIPPFPDNIDRAAFGHYLSGFVDGEGCFGLYYVNASARQKTPAARFIINLRADDLPILQLIRSFLGCGTIDNDVSQSQQHHRWHPKKMFRVYRLIHHTRVLIPHFACCPLRAKKRADFLIWKEAVEWMHSIVRLHPRPSPFRRVNLPRWTDERLAHFERFRLALKATREFNSSELPPLPPPPPPPPDPLPLFDEP